MGTNLKRAVALAGITACAMAVPAMAGAADGDSSCSTDDVCFYYNSNQMNARSTFIRQTSPSVERNHVNYTFGGGSSLPGNGLTLKNKAASWRNNSGSYTALVWYNTGCEGPNQDLPTGYGNLNSTLKNNNACHNWAIAGQ